MGTPSRMKRPAFQFYPGDWRKNARLRRCSPAARGVWVDVMCLMHDSDEYGVLRWPLKEIAQAAGATKAHLNELVAKGVLKGADRGASPYVWAPNHAGQRGDEVVLVAVESAPVWYCSRMVRDEHKRKARGSTTRFQPAQTTEGGSPNPKPKGCIGDAIGGESGDGASSSSSSSSSKQEQKLSPTTLPARPPAREALPPSGARVTAAGEACRLMREAGATTANPSHPDLLAAIAEGCTPQELADTVTEALGSGVTRPFPWAIKTARSRRASGHRQAVTFIPRGSNHAAHRQDRESRSARIERKNRDLDEREQREAEAHAGGNVIEHAR